MIAPVTTIDLDDFVEYGLRSMRSGALSWSEVVTVVASSLEADE
jgi:hypothetical protein